MRLPPHSAAIMRARRFGRVPVPGIFGHVTILPSWDLEINGAYVIAPSELNPIDLDFCFVAGLEVSLFIRNCDRFRLVDLLRAVMRCDPLTVNVVNLDQSCNGFSYGLEAVYARRQDHG